MSLPSPSASSFIPDLTDDYPPLRSVQVHSYLQVAEETVIDVAISERDAVTDYDNGYPVGTNTSALGSGETLEIEVRAGTAYVPVRLGYEEVTWDGVDETVTDEVVELPQSFAHVDTTTPPYTYQRFLRVWRHL